MFPEPQRQAKPVWEKEEKEVGILEPPSAECPVADPAASPAAPKVPPAPAQGKAPLHCCPA